MNQLINDEEKLLLSWDNQEIISFAVIDNCIEIPKDKIKMIFEAFKQADNSTIKRYSGMGLGLSISRDLAKLLGGEINVESKENKGSTFTFCIPLDFLTVQEIEITI